jgi:hypothetical protein
MLRRIVTALLLVPLATLLVAFAVANRQSVIISFDPFEPMQPAYAVALPLFALVLFLAIAGVVVGGVAAWLKQSKWRRAARLAQGQARELRAEVERLKRRVGEPPVEAMPLDYAPRLTIPPPAA